MWHATTKRTPGGSGGGEVGAVVMKIITTLIAGGPIINDYEELWYSFMLI